ncbi:glycine betaine/L-proline ABC transporter ATP-binding protein [Pseudomonas sp. JS3066]|jgi:glycine betaine/proline transport system ATP-binding protein|uniref:quaternary amine ABC transporter ATP-binding protein n=1 Tax=unclassified Pseudomonas TaxID=196821 RepID=UPI000EAA0BC3|nr:MULTISPECIES: glycine betaine/L-proline ABC transporter ATP-binding protein [unclassified Pseudomonas]AYF88978.1 glycine betaine/L-proline ABC transporter ATP-binding protein [Pseudomonas sp. DY-1]MDH4653171.1 glycine betaine/L-proline ABC transporter ATP-binding protein [Pseudomonas sp. BN606]MRK21107.1 glycine betaine/L-proline ABC transporter ATP-binding protein [Pseudomonas sp. JG-B]WVK93484.1 glycine betaine/L-proline ABC transporter ATP-binding protein [Pseudomonas sp. JS3066]
MQSGKIVVQNLYKVFGQQPQEAIDLLKQGWSKEKILAERGAVIGVSDVSFSVNEGEIFVLMGLSGSGKSTLIRLINRLIEPTAGDVFIDGQNVAKLPTSQLIDLRRRDMSMVFQSFALMPSRCVLDNAAFGLEVAGKSKKEREKRAMEVLEQVGLASFAHKYPHELSGGMQQRVGLARALAVDPSMIIMDEAFSALDPLKRREMQDVLLDLQKKHSRTIIFVSHDIEEAMRIGSRIGIMEGGKLIQVGTPQEIIENPANDYVRNFFNTVDTSRYLTAGQLKSDSVPLFVHNGKAPDAQTVCQKLQALDKHYAFIVDEKNNFRGSISLEKIALLVEGGRTLDLEQNLLKHIDPVPEDLPLDSVIQRLVINEGPIPVVDQSGRYSGAISKGRLLSRLRGE